MSTTLEETSYGALPKPPKRTSVYFGDPSMWSWVLHRITGVALFFFLFVHVLDTAVIALSPAEYTEVINTYKNPLMGTGEIFLLIALLYHSLNGLRVVLVDFWHNGPKYNRLMLWAVFGVWIIVSFAGAIRLGSIILHYLGT